MANKHHLKIFEKGVKAWNKWRIDNPKDRPDLSGELIMTRNLKGINFKNTNLSRTLFSPLSDLDGANLSGADLFGSKLVGTKLNNTNLQKADLGMALLNVASMKNVDLSHANLSHANLSHAKLSHAKLNNTNLSHADLSHADLSHADLIVANLEMANLVQTNLKYTKISYCLIYGISAWNLKTNGKTIQSNLGISPLDKYKPKNPIITVDSLEVAQFINLLINNKNIRHAIDTLTSKIVLILGRFTPKRKAVLEAIRQKLKKHDFIPVIFDFDKPSQRDVAETISTLAHIAKFIIVDITEPRSVPQELQRIIPNLPSVPVQPIIHSSAKKYGMFEHFQQFPWVLPIYKYKTIKDVIGSLEEKIIKPAESKGL